MRRLQPAEKAKFVLFAKLGGDAFLFKGGIIVSRERFW